MPSANLSGVFGSKRRRAKYNQSQLNTGAISKMNSPSTDWNCEAGISAPNSERSTLRSVNKLMLVPVCSKNAQKTMEMSVKQQRHAQPITPDLVRHSRASTRTARGTPRAPKTINIEPTNAPCCTNCQATTTASTVPT